jgi:hypothetical protein
LKAWPVNRVLRDGRMVARVMSAIALMSIAVLAGAFVAGAVPLPETFHLPPATILMIAVFIAALPLLLQNWRTAALVFLAWLMVEDLFRKLAGNDLTIYFVKDVLYVVLLAAIATDGTFKGAWRSATAGVRWWLYALVAWALVMSIPTGLEDWRVPLVGLRLDFLYVPLVALGYEMVRTARGPQRWLVRLAILGGAASVVGLIQAVIGPSFLAPDEPTPGLTHLVLVRGLPETGSVYRPTGTFVDPGRFESAALIALTIGLAAALVSRGRRRVWATIAALTGAASVWVSGGRASLLAALALVMIAAVGTASTGGRRFLRKGTAAAGIAAASAVLVVVVSPALFHSRLLWYEATLNPQSPGNEWSSRWDAYGGDTLRGVALGGLIGQGTGEESLGKQYLYGALDPSAPIYQVEGGYAALAVEWGVVGLALWVGWSVAWVRRQWRIVRMCRGSPAAGTGLVLLGWTLFFLFLHFFAGLQGFQNYLANAYFWLLSGVIAALPEASRRDDGRGSNVADA